MCVLGGGPSPVPVSAALVSDPDGGWGRFLMVRHHPTDPPAATPQTAGSERRAREARPGPGEKGSEEPLDPAP